MKFRALLFILVMLCSRVPGYGVWVSAAPLPNVVFILADDLGWSDTTLHGTTLHGTTLHGTTLHGATLHGATEFYKTPKIQRLAERGLMFTRPYAARPLCSPTRSAMLSGLSPAHAGLATPNCHLPQVVLKATEGVNALPNKHAIQPKPIALLGTGHANRNIKSWLLSTLIICQRFSIQSYPRTQPVTKPMRQRMPTCNSEVRLFDGSDIVLNCLKQSFVSDVVYVPPVE